eukprot:m.154665 g.154665  ORF g.154665 m.154665 type:complete len:739 (+) comp16258_c5_seq1:32-2248(+)
MVDKKGAAALKPAKKVLNAASSASISSRSQLMVKSASKLHSQSKHRLSKQVDHDSEEWLQAKDPVKPADQLHLTDEELGQELTRILRADNPNAPDNIVRFSYKDGAYKQMASVDQCAFHFTLNGTVIHKESDEARRQLARHRFKSKGSKTDMAVDAATAVEKAETEAENAEGTNEADGEDEGVQTEEGDNGGEEAEEQEDKEGNDDDDEDGGESGDPDKPLRNQFNFSERAAQCFAPARRDRETMTEAPQRTTFSANATQWTIYDAYVADQERQNALKGKRRVSSAKTDKSTARVSHDIGEDSGSDWHSAAKLITLSTAKKMERLVNQNTFHEVAHDFKYWDDPSDQFKEKQGSLLPLWRFTNDITKRKAVTSMRWCPDYPDLVLVGYGSYDYTKQTGGAICAYSLKSPSYPEYIITTTSGVMCIDVHSKHCSLIVAGFYDGSVAVYDLSRKSSINTPIAFSTAKTGKHTDPVWRVEWHQDDVDQNHNFSSVSSDGRVTTWTMIQTELQHTDIIRLSFDTSKKPPSDDNTDPLFGLGAGTCLDFNDQRENVFLVGTEEGNIHQCSRAYTSKFLKTFKAHSMAVYTVTWNPFHPRIFASCSADWTVKIWDDLDQEPVFTFDLGNSVGDVAWSPYSPCVFAAVTTDGKVHVFDLQQNKYEPICEQQVTKKAKLTHVLFNVKDPIIVVGDDRGAASTFKLSPNLRKLCDDKKKKTQEELVAMFDRLLESVKETPHVPVADA